MARPLTGDVEPLKRADGAATTPASPWPTLLVDLDAPRDRYIKALEATKTGDPDADVADAVASTLEVLSDVARVATTRLEARALMRAALDHLLHAELSLRARVCSCPPRDHPRRARVAARTLGGEAKKDDTAKERKRAP
jgi:hypothetical protein